MKKYILSFSILVSTAIFSVIIINTALAQSDNASPDTLSNLTYPIAELGSCKDRADCKIYCDDSANITACINYAEQKSLLSQDDLQKAKKFVAGGSKGPGGCNGKKECQTFCEDKTNIDECVSYAENNGLMSEQDLQKAKKVQSAIKKGVRFPSCKNKKECDVYCEESSHMEECITFAKEAGLLDDKELANSDKVLTAIKQGITPPPCRGKDACDVYCAEDGHADECVNFAIAAGLVTGEEARIIKETGGKGPGGCKNKKDCDSYCSNPANKEACRSFAEEHNIPRPEKPQKPGQQKQDGTSGPGNSEGQGGRTQGDGLQQPANPTKCIAECETDGKNCISVLGGENEVCRSIGQNCREVTCETKDAEGNRSTADVMHRCNNDICVPLETSCNDIVTAKDSACRTKKDQCVGQCQKAEKPAKPTQPPQSNQERTGGPGNGAGRGKGGPGAGSGPGNGAGQGGGTPAGGLQKPVKPSEPNQPTGTGSCGDGKCGRMEQANPLLCPQDCGGGQ